MASSNHQKLLDKCLYAYFVKKGMYEAATAFANEVDVGTPTDDAIKSLEGFLADWWDSFYSMFSSIQAKYAQDPYAEDEAEDIEQTMNMEPIVNTPEKAASGSRSFLKGSSTSVMQQAP
uniref:WD-repeat protein n=1 Tax=Solanum tuberosum TaxID=4113 RepID=M1DRM6_SOLTU